MDRLGMNSKVKQVSSSDSALASDIFDKFCNATTLKTIVGYHRQMCDVLNLKPNHFPSFYPKLRQNVNSWRAKALWKKFDLRASHKCYARGKACPNTRVLIVGAGPCGLRAAIEAQLLGAKVVCVEKRDRMSRNNVLHLWPFVIEDLRALGAKKFFGKFCAGAIDHISIRQLQCILLKVALLLGVEIHTEISFLKMAPPPSREESEERIGWRGQFSPIEHPVNQYEFDVLIGADGRRNTLEGFRRKEFRGRLAIAITANFINKRTEAEARVEEISGVAFIFNQKFFKDLYEATGIDLENIVYYKDDTHYFVMTAKKQSLLEKGVIINDIADTSKLLGRENVDVDALQNYAREAADFSTQYQMPDLEFAVNHYGNHDVNMFDFTSMYAAENASKVLEKNGHRLLMILVGDSLLEPFWPTGSGCARGFLSSMDACWAIRGWGSGSMTPLEVLAERESIYRLLGQTTPENLQRDSKSYTLDPSTRYPNLNKSSLLPAQVTSLYDTDDPSIISNMITGPPLSVNSAQQLHKKRKNNDDTIHPRTLVLWLKRQLEQFEDILVEDLTTSFKSGLVLCAVINRYRPDLLDFHALKKEDIAQNNQLAFDILEKELGIPPVITGQEIAENAVPDFLTILAYLSQIYETFRGEIPHIKHPKLDLSEIKTPEQRPLKIKEFDFASKTNICAGPLPGLRKHRRFEPLHVHHGVSASTDATERKTRKRRSMDKVGASVEERQKRLEEISSNRNERMCRRRQQRKNQTENFIKSMQMLHANAKFEEGGPFEDYSILVYRQTAPNFGDRVKDLELKLSCPDRDVKIGNQIRGEKDEDFSGRIKDFEDKLREQAPQEKKPKDLLRAIGKIETTDWNVKEIEKKIIENKIGKSVNKEKEKVPKWSNEQFLARRTKMEKKGLDRQDSEDKKYTAIDKSIRQLDQKLREGNIRELNQNKVSSITEQFKKQPEAESKPIQKSNSKVIVPSSGGSENCHFCGKRVYLMERLSTEGRFFHRGCFRCQYCNITLRLGSYHFDRDGKYGYKFYCSQHFGMPGQLKVTKTRGKVSKGTHDTPEKSTLRTQRVDTPERIEFANVSPSSEQEESYSPMDEEEWTDRNFGASTAEIGSSDDDSSESGDSDDDEAFEEALDEPVTKEGTRRIAKEWVKRYSRERDLEDSSTEDYDTGSEFSYESSDDDVKDSATEGEEEIRARELRKQEVRLRQPIVPTDTGSDTEMASEESDESSSDKENSATDIPTDSEFDHDDRTPTSELHSLFNDANVTKTRGSSNLSRDTSAPKRVQVKSGVLQRPVNSLKTGNFKLTSTTNTVAPQSHAVATPDITNVRPTPLVNPRKGDYLLNRTQSTGGIASKVSLELKKKYLLGGSGLPGSIQKSGSTTTLDSKFKSFTSKISEHQKLLNPAPEISPTMQAFLQGSSKICTPLSPTNLNPKSPTFPILDDSLKNQQSELKSPEIIDLTLSPSDKFSMQPDITKDLLPEDAPPKTTCDYPKLHEEQTQPDVIFPNETEGRPRSPVHETSIIVPEISWNNKPENKSESDIDSDSLSSSDSSDDEDDDMRQEKSIGKVFNDIPRVEIHDSAGELLHEDEIAMDSLCINPVPEVRDEPSRSTQPTSLASDAPKSILSEKKTLNQPKVLPGFDAEHIECLIDVNGKKKDFPPFEVKEDSKTESKPSSSGRNTPLSDPESVCNDATTAALTETELSDWARDGAVSDNLEDVEFDINPDKPSKKLKSGKKRSLRSNARIAMVEDFEDTGHICGKDKTSFRVQNGAPIAEIADFDSIEYMDTGSEVSLEDDLIETTNAALLKNRGYVHFVSDIKDPHEDENNIALDSLNPIVCHQEIVNNNKTVEAVNKNVIFPLSSLEQNTGYCVFGNENENENYRGKLSEEVVEVHIKPSEDELSEDKQKINLVCDNEFDDSLLTVETGTTTEENTVSDSTVKNFINEAKSDSLPEKVLEKISTAELEEAPTPTAEDHNGIEYDEHVKRLQSKYAEFGSVRDSIDIRKSKRKNKSDSPPSLTEHKECDENNSNRVVSPAFSSPATSRKLEEINKERSKQNDVIRGLVLDKVKLKKATDKKRRIRESFSPISSPIRRNFELAKSATVDITPQIESSKSSLSSGFYTNTDSIKTTEMNTLQKSPTVGELIHDGKENVYPLDRTDSLTSAEIFTPVTSLKDLNPKTLARPLSMHGSFIVSSKPTIIKPIISSDSYSLSNIDPVDFIKTPIAPPRIKHDEAKKTAEKLKQDARSRARLMSDEDLGLSPEDKMNIYRQKANKFSRQSSKEECIQDSIESLVLNTEKRNALLLNDTLKKKKSTEKLQNSFSNSDIPHKLSLYNDNIERSRTKSVSEISKRFKTPSEEALKMSLSSNMIHSSEVERKQQFYKSDPNLLTEEGCKKEKKTTKDRERRKSIIKSVTDFFHKKKEPSVKSPNSSNSSGSVKERFSRFRISPKQKEKSKERNTLEPPRIKSLSESSLKDSGNVSPPPIPPPPLNYSASNSKDESGSESEIDWKRLNHSSETLDQSGAVEGSGNSIGRRRVSRSLRKASKQAQIKRHRLAQEIQRKLEETEVKTRELEERGVMVEKALRGETKDESGHCEETELLREWFDLMRDRTELRRYEKELLIRGQELELEDRHARLQQELRDRLAGDDEEKTQDDVAAEGAILSEMLEIVAKRDSLIAVLEEDRQRCSLRTRRKSAPQLLPSTFSKYSAKPSPSEHPVLTVVFCFIVAYIAMLCFVEYLFYELM